MIKRIFLRIKQFFKSLVLKPSEEDLLFAKSYLTIEEAALFDNLPGYEKKHAIDVARQMADVTRSSNEIKEKEIVKFALLHDIGKATIKLSLPDKAVLIVLRRILPGLYNSMAAKGESGRGFVSKKFYVHKYHAKIGAELLRRAGIEESVAKLVELHDKEPEPDDPIELMLLRQLDDRN